MNRSWVAISFAAVVSVAGVARAEKGSPAAVKAHAEAEQHVLKAKEYFRDQRYPEAEAEFEAALSLDPGWHELHFNLAAVRDAEGKLWEAAQSLREYLPYASASEAEGIRQKLAEIEVQAKDEDREHAARNAQEQERQRHQSLAEEQLAAGRREAERAAYENQRVDVECKPKEACDSLYITAQNKQVGSCVGTGGLCRLHLQPMAAKVVWDTGRENEITIPQGPSVLRVTKGHDNVGVTLGLLGLAAGVGDIVLLGYEASDRAHPGAGAVAGVIGLGIASAVGLLVGFSIGSPSVEIGR